MSYYCLPKKYKANQELLNEFNIDNYIEADDFDGIDEFKNGECFSKIAWKNRLYKKNILKFLKINKKNRN